MKIDYELITTAGNLLRITAYGTENLPNQKFIIAVHGFKGFKDWGFFPYVGNYFSDSGYFVITFNFSHNGIGENPTEFTELEKFAENTFTLEVNELIELISAIKNGFFGDVENPKIGLIGHSRGGAISLLSAFHSNNVDALVTWSSISKFDRYTERQKKEWNEKGFLEVINSRTKQIMKLNKSLLEDISRNSGDYLNLKNAAGSISIPWLIVHGENDLAVKAEEGRKLFEWSDKNKTEFVLIPKTGHTFDVVHPMQNVPKAFEQVISVTGKFFEQNL